MEISRKIAKARKLKGFTQEELADKTNVTVRTIQRIENGESLPRAYTLKSIATALEMDYEDLIQQNSVETNSPIINDKDEKRFLRIFTLANFTYLLIPFFHFLIPYYLFKNYRNKSNKATDFCTSVVQQQIAWVIGNSLMMLLTMLYNFAATSYFDKAFTLNYVWVFFAMYLLNAMLIFMTCAVLKFFPLVRWNHNRVYLAFVVRMSCS